MNWTMYRAGSSIGDDFRSLRGRSWKIGESHVFASGLICQRIGRGIHAPR